MHIDAGLVPKCNILWVGFQDLRQSLTEAGGLNWSKKYDILYGRPQWNLKKTYIILTTLDSKRLLSIEVCL